MNNRKQKQPIDNWRNNVVWFTASSHVIGIVRVEEHPFDYDDDGNLVKNDFTGPYKYYIGIGAGYDEQADFQRIRDWGAKYPRPAGDALFNHDR